METQYQQKLIEEVKNYQNQPLPKSYMQNVNFEKFQSRFHFKKDKQLYPDRSISQQSESIMDFVPFQNEREKGSGKLIKSSLAEYSSTTVSQNSNLRKSSIPSVYQTNIELKKHIFKYKSKSNIKLGNSINGSYHSSLSKQPKIIVGKNSIINQNSGYYDVLAN